MCLISSSEIQKRIIFKVHAPRHGLFLSSSNISAFCPAFPPPTHAGLSLDRHIAICSRQSFAGLIFYPSRTANTNFPLYVHQTPSLSRRSRHPPAPVFRRPYLLSVPNGKRKFPPACAQNPILEPPAPPPSVSVFPRSYLLSVPDGKRKLPPVCAPHP